MIQRAHTQVHNQKLTFVLNNKCVEYDQPVPAFDFGPRYPLDKGINKTICRILKGRWKTCLQTDTYVLQVCGEASELLGREINIV